jgi:hypothetical protein
LSISPACSAETTVLQVVEQAGNPLADVRILHRLDEVAWPIQRRLPSVATSPTSATDQALNSVHSLMARAACTSTLTSLWMRSRCV